MDDWKKPWKTNFLTMGEFTSDRRQFLPGSVTTRNPPMPLCLQVKTGQGHNGAVVVGTVEEVGLTDTLGSASGSWMDPEKIPEVIRALELTRNRVAKVSADLEPDMVVRVEEPDTPGSRPFIYYERAKVCGLTIVPIGAFDLPGVEPILSIPEYVALSITGTTSWRSMPAIPRESPYNADEAFKRILAWSDGSDDRARSMFLWYDPRAAEGTRDRFRLPIGDIVNGKPALSFHAVYAAAALISGAHGGLPSVSDEERGRLRRTISEIYQRLAGLFGDPGLVAPWDKRSKLPDVRASSLDAVAASAAPVAPSASWFANPNLPGPVPSPIVTPEGRVMVHLATHGSCHRAIQQVTGQCFTPPPSPSEYRRFMDGSLVTSTGETIAVGRITAGTTHATLAASSQGARHHYDNTGTCVAVVVAGEDEHGIWLSGALVPEATPEQVAMLRRSPISGDWRKHGGEGLDLVAALCVNTAGWPAPPRGAVRTLSVDHGECYALVASGALMGDEEGPMDDTETRGIRESDGAAPEATPGPNPTLDVEAITKAAASEAVTLIRRQDEVDGRLAILLEVQRQRREASLSGFQRLGDFSPASGGVAERRAAQKRGEALPPLQPGGTPRYPIENVVDLGKAIRAVGRGKGDHDALRRWIIKRAGELGRKDMIPENWNPDGSMKA
jgi:hypothetical protein